MTKATDLLKEYEYAVSLSPSPMRQRTVDVLRELIDPWVSVMSNPPKLGQWCLLCDNGVVKREAFQWDAVDDDSGLVYFWYRDDCDPIAPSESQAWQRLPSPPTNPTGDSK